MQASALQKINDIAAQLNAALLLKDQLAEQVEQNNERVKALRNLLAGIELGRQATTEAPKSDINDMYMVD